MLNSRVHCGMTSSSSIADVKELTCSLGGLLCVYAYSKGQIKLVNLFYQEAVVEFGSTV